MVFISVNIISPDFIGGSGCGVSGGIGVVLANYLTANFMVPFYLKPQAVVYNADNCTIYSCQRKGEVLIVSSSQETCPDVSGCPAHLLVTTEGGCCKLCKSEPPAEDQKNCLPVSLVEPLTVELIEIVQPGVGKCVNKAPIQGFTDCEGACSSGSKYNKDSATHEKHCHCCSIKSWKAVTVPLICENGSKLEKKVDVPASCGCSPCAENTDYDIGDKIDVRMQTLPKILSGQLSVL
ncbi:hemocytin-like [Rhagoletis pomonella]|uniref:hemocytin-like n=1 Tax=Rhagoletis pomonella TaxID=28610 RepID=UPI001782D6CA|nr:hemocytin-like [Rhagoletis pomonella]